MKFQISTERSEGARERERETKSSVGFGPRRYRRREKEKGMYIHTAKETARPDRITKNKNS